MAEKERTAACAAAKFDDDLRLHLHQNLLVDPAIPSTFFRTGTPIHFTGSVGENSNV